ncbi:MAG: exodeoxyribonuclease VII small subunit [Ardenticatenia bacterium]|nr:exodeoxyribonuclease VII small subunit [Ardenticatenia bacterium]
MEEILELKFEAAVEELETVVGRLEEEELPLEEAIALFERGQALLARCQDQLTAAELKVQQLTVEGT